MKIIDLEKIFIPDQEVMIFNQYECEEKKAYYIGAFMDTPKKLKKKKISFITPYYNSRTDITQITIAVK